MLIKNFLDLYLYNIKNNDRPLYTGYKLKES